MRASSRDGTPLNVEARKGVLLAAGGFGHNADMRRRNTAATNPTTPSGRSPTPATPARCCRPRCGWAPRPICWTKPGGCLRFSSPTAGAVAASLGSGRQRPGAIYVDSTGRRFCNESNSYVEVGKAMYANKAVPCWMVFDDGYVRRYVTGTNPLKWSAANLPPELIDSGAVKRGRHHCRSGPPDRPARTTNWTQYGPAVQPVCGQGPRPRLRTRPVGVQRLPGRSRVPAQCRGRPAGPRRRTTRRGLLPADVGTCGGVITNEYAQVLDENDRVIDGPVRHRQHHRDGDGPNLSGRRREHRQLDGVRLCGRTPCRRSQAGRRAEPLARSQVERSVSWRVSGLRRARRNPLASGLIA